MTGPLLYGLLATLAMAGPGSESGSAIPVIAADRPAEARSEIQAGAPVAGPEPRSPLVIGAAALRSYVDPTHRFRVDYPAGFVVASRDASALGRFTPRPIAAVFFMNPTMAAGALAGIEPPDLEVRVYEARTAGSLESWLVEAGLASAAEVAAARPYRNARAKGLQVCAATMIAPGCSTYVLEGGRVFQLTPISIQGEAMVRSFSLPPPGGASRR